MVSKTPTFCITVLFVFFITGASAQSVSPITINVGGGTYSSEKCQFDWSLGEATAIETLQSTSNFIITGGVLQPLTERSGLLDNVVLPWYRDEISIFPVPTHTITTIDIKIQINGRSTIQLFDQTGRAIQEIVFDYTGANGRQKMNLTSVVPGTYFLKVTLAEKQRGTQVYTIIRTGTFKIQKI